MEAGDASNPGRAWKRAEKKRNSSPQVSLAQRPQRASVRLPSLRVRASLEEALRMGWELGDSNVRVRSRGTGT